MPAYLHLAEAIQAQVTHRRRFRACAFRPWIVIALFLCCTLCFVSAEVLDRVVAVVDGRPILATEWDDTVRYECFLNQCALNQLTTPDRRATLQRMIDQRLIEQEMKLEDPNQAQPKEIAKKVAELRKQVVQGRTPGAADSAAEWSEALAQYSLTEQEIEDHVARELNVLRFVERRFRPTTQIDAAQVERYYNETLMPELQKAGAPDPPLAQVAGQIRELLTQKAIDEQLSLWVETLRKQGKIQMK
jgi:hypothetical protein